MNIKQAKTIALTDYLQCLGFFPAMTRGNEFWYRSPFRPDERTPSFKIDASKNVWFDHGLGQGGTIIDFVQCLHQVENVSRVLAIIEETQGGIIQTQPSPGEQKKVSAISQKDALELDALTDISDGRLIDYLTSRAIPIELARLYLKEACYRIGTHSYKALAFPNDSGGFELRNARFQGTLHHKDVSFIINSERRDVVVFEGFFDFLSTLVYYGKSKSNSNVLVLNSVGMVDRAIKKLQEHRIDTLYTYLDHDTAGERAREKFQKSENGFVVQDASNLYRGYKDANEMLIAHVASKQKIKNFSERER